MLFIAKHCAEISPQVFPDVLCSSLSMSVLCLLSLPLFSDLSLLHFVPEAVASFSIASRGVPHSLGDAWAWLPCGDPGKVAAASLGARAPTVSGG